MIHEDTINLLKECNAGVKMGVSSIDEILKDAQDPKLVKILSSSKDEYCRLGDETRRLLNSYDEEGKDPNPMAKSMSWIKTNVKLTIDESDETIADLMTDGCNMGVKSLNKYLNQYEAADEKSKDITKRLINLEEKLTIDIRKFL